MGSERIRLTKIACQQYTKPRACASKRKDVIAAYLITVGPVRDGTVQARTSYGRYAFIRRYLHTPWNPLDGLFRYVQLKLAFESATRLIATCLLIEWMSGRVVCASWQVLRSSTVQLIVRRLYTFTSLPLRKKKPLAVLTNEGQCVKHMLSASV